MLLLILAMTLALPIVQTKIAQQVVKTLNEKFGTEIFVERVDISVFGTVSLKNVSVQDNHDYKFIEIGSFKTSILDFNELLEGRLFFGKVKADQLLFHIKTYQGEENSNLNLFINAFDDGSEGDGSFRLSFKELAVKDSHFMVSNENSAVPISVDFTELNGVLERFLVKGPDIFSLIKTVQFHDHRGLDVEDMQGDFSLTKTNIDVKDMVLKTKNSNLEGQLRFTFSGDDMQDFLNKVDWDLRLSKASIGTNDINCFYPEFGKNQRLFLKTDIKGVMNNFTLNNLKIIDDHYSEIIGGFRFMNLFDDVKPFSMEANLTRLATSYYDLVDLMPNVLGNTLPEELARLGNVSLNGVVELSTTVLKTDVKLTSSAGLASATLEMKGIDNIKSATYTGNVVLDHFNLGAILEDDNFGVTSVNLNLDGKGFDQEHLNTSLEGTVASFSFNGYNYQNITLDGFMKMPYYKGYLSSKDPNLIMDFDGVIDWSAKVKEYDFEAKIDYADLYALKLVNDTLSHFSGNLSLKASGNSIDDLQGELQATNSVYKNSKDDYAFASLSVKSEFDENTVRTIVVNSDKAIEGTIVGNYKVAEMKYLVQNALGSLYTNYSPFKVKENQYVDFDMTISNRLIEVFLPQLSLSENTKISGTIDGDKGAFKLRFNSPNVAVNDMVFTNIMLNVNNQNPLYNTYISLDSLKLKNYTLSDFDLINVTHNDTLFVRSEFKGGSQGKDNYNLNLYHTINEDNMSVVGIKKSEVKFKDYLWFLNEKEDRDNKIVFNKKLTDFKVEEITLSHNDQIVKLGGVMRDSTYKDLRLSFDKVDLNKITPDINNLTFAGDINGDVHFEQKGQVFHPSSNIKIDSLSINEVYLGDLKFAIDGDERLQNFKVASNIVKGNKESFYLNGDINIINRNSYLNLESGFKDFQIKTLEPLLSSIVSDVRGTTSGKISILGTPKRPDVNGRLYLNQAGMKSKFTGVDYNFEEEAPLDLTEKQFILKNVKLIDSKFKTSGAINGSISHKMFDDWSLDLQLKSDNLLALDTKYEEGSIYYGTAFINGTASLSGPVDLLSINIEATSNKGTSIKIPLKEVQGLGDSSFIHFLTPQEKADRLKGIDNDIYRYRNSGIELDFEFVLTPDAEIEIILDRESGHAMRGRGAGFITMEINTLGKFNMWGDFQAYEGEYNFKYGGIIDKKFVVKRYGTIRWDGDPMNAALDLQAIYHTEANPSVIIDNSVINRKIPTDVSIVLNGSLSNPEVDFEILFPNVSSVIRSEIEYKLSDKDTRERQAMALLATGTFFSSDNSSSSLAGSLFERASSIFDDIFSDADDKVRIGLNYAQADRNPYTQTEGRVGVTFSTQVNDRITVNGKLGVPVGGAEESVIVGDVEVLLRLNENGTLNARVFNRENDINYIGEGIGYTQGVGLSYEVDFDTFKELIRKILNKAEEGEQQKKTNSTTDDLPDSNYNSDFIKFYENRRSSQSDSQSPEDILD